MLQHRLVTARFFSCGVWEFGVMASRGSMFWVLSALTLCSKFVGGTALEARLGWDGLEFLSTTAESTPGFDPQATAHTNNMADQLPAFDESLFEGETLTSKNGASSRVGREKTDCVKGDAIKAVAGNGLGIDAYWPADGRWKKTSDEVADNAGIAYVRLTDTGASENRYNFEFNNTEVFYYHFFDERGNPHAKITTQTGKHSFSYDSYSPTIMKVTYE